MHVHNKEDTSNSYTFPILCHVVMSFCVVLDSSQVKMMSLLLAFSSRLTFHRLHPSHYILSSSDKDHFSSRQDIKKENHTLSSDGNSWFRRKSRRQRCQERHVSRKKKRRNKTQTRGKILSLLSGRSLSGVVLVS